MNVYLAGKISRHCWRNEFVQGLSDVDADDMEVDHPYVIKDGISPGIHYSGPYFSQCGGHGAAHVPHSHASGVIHSRHYWDAFTDNRNNAWLRCITALRNSDVVIANLTEDAFGTIAEVGVAFALDRRVLIVDGRKEYDHLRDDLWFVKRCGESVSTVPDAIAKLQKLRDVACLREKCQSEPERILYDLMSEHPVGVGFVPQHPVGRFCVDFASPKYMLAIEIDGLKWHGGQLEWTRDRRRQRIIESHGWTVLRFAAKEVTEDPAMVFHEILEAVKKRKKMVTAGGLSNV